MYSFQQASPAARKPQQPDQRSFQRVTVNLSGRLPFTVQHGDFRADFLDENRSAGLTLFNQRRHDFGEKHFLGATIHGEGAREIATAIAILAAQPATAHFVSRKLAQYFCCDAPSEKLVAAMAATWRRSDGDIAQVLATLFDSREFTASLGQGFDRCPANGRRRLVVPQSEFSRPRHPGQLAHGGARVAGERHPDPVIHVRGHHGQGVPAGPGVGGDGGTDLRLRRVAHVGQDRRLRLRVGRDT